MRGSRMGIAPLTSVSAAAPRRRIASGLLVRRRSGMPMAVLLVLSSITFAMPTDATSQDAAIAQIDWGASLSPAQGAEVHRRSKLQALLGKAFRAAASDRNSAGAYFDEGDVPVFLTSGDPAKVRGKLARLIPGGVKPRFRKVPYSTADLYALQDRINADLSAGSLRDEGITSTGIDTRANVVVVGSSRVTDELRRSLGKHYGEGLVLAFEPDSQGGDAGGSCVSRTECSPVKGGLEIRSTYNGGFCTTGPLVRVASSSSIRILTSGHCLGKSGGTGTSRKWTHNGAQVGWSEFYFWANGADADVALINPVSGVVTGDRNLVYESSATDIVGLQTWKPTAEQVQGSIVCRAGAVSGYRCGIITLTNKTKDVDGHSIDHQWVVDFDACPGDSGAPYLVDSVVWGIHSDSTFGCEPTTNEAWYSPMGWVFSVLSSHGHPMELCSDPTCISNANSWKPRGSLNGDVWNPTLVKLLDGRVLQVGGEGGDPLWQSALDGPGRAPQFFDPASGAWSDTAAPPWLPDRCAGQFAVGLSDGTVLVGGGVSTAGGGADPCSGAAYRFDPSDGPEGSWSTAAAMPQAISSAGALLLADGRAFITGGTGTSGTASVALAYAPMANTWTTLTPAPGGAIAPLTLRLDDGRVLVSGGYTITDPSGPRYADNGATYLYNPTTDTWSTTSSIGARGRAGLILSDGRVAVAGGQHLSWNGGQSYAFVTSVHVLNPATGVWTQLAPLRTARAQLTFAQLQNGQLLAAGGLVAGSGPASGSASKTADVYDWATNAWYPAAALQAARADQGSLLLGDGTVLAAGGGSDSSETYTPGDVTPPAVGTPLTSMGSGGTIGSSTVPARISWSATDAGGSGLGLYDIARSKDGGAFTTLATSLTSAAYSTSLAVGHTYRFQVRGRDNAGNLGPWKAAATVSAGITQQSSTAVKYAGTWSTASSSNFSGGSLKAAYKAGASATYTFTGRSIGWVTTRSSRNGAARLYVDGVLVSSLYLYASSTTYRYVAFQKAWTTTGTHTIKVVAVGTARHPRIDIDAFVVLR